MWIMAKVQRVTKTNTPTCKLDENDCLSLLHILKAFDGPINEERTWAVLHQAAKCANSCFLSSTSTTASTDSTTFKCCVASEPAHILIHRDGSVHPKSFTVDITSDLSKINILLALLKRKANSNGSLHICMNVTRWKMNEPPVMSSLQQFCKYGQPLFFLFAAH